MLVTEIMTKDVASVRPDDRMSDAARLLWEHDCGCLPVVSDGLGVVGMLTDRDICMAAYTQGKPLEEIDVSSAMNRTVHAVSPADPLSTAEEIMSRKQVRRVPVVDESNRLVGVLSLNDLACESATEGAVSKDEVADTLAAVCRHRRELAPTAAGPRPSPRRKVR